MVCYTIEREGAPSPFLFVCEHASKLIPAPLNNLGLEEVAASSHIAWDIGALDVARILSFSCDATLIFQNFSRLVYDCNRSPQAATAIPLSSEIYAIPGNENLSEREKFDRLLQIYVPFHQAIDAEIAKRCQRKQETIFITIHSFTPVFHGQRRDCEIGFLYDLDDAAFGRHLLARAQASNRFKCRENEPYGPQDGQTMHTVRLHARSQNTRQQNTRQGLKNVMVEIRHDLIANPEGAKDIAAWLGDLLRESAAAFGIKDERGQNG